MRSIALQSSWPSSGLKQQTALDLLPSARPLRRGRCLCASDEKQCDVSLDWEQLSTASLDEVLSAWKHQSDRAVNVEGVKPRDVKAAADTIATVFFEPSSLAFLDDAFKYQLKGEVTGNILAGLHYRGRGDYAVLAVWDERRETVLGAVQVSRQDDVEVIRRLSTEERSYAYISSMAVLPFMRRKGIGSALLEAAEFVAWTWGEAEIVLHVFEDNEPALRLYTNSGYEEVQQPESGIFAFLPKPKTILLRRQW